MKYRILIIMLCLAAQSRAQHIFFPGDLVERIAQIPVDFIPAEKPAGPHAVTVAVHSGEVIAPVSRYLFGTNANVYMTQMVDQPVLLDRIKRLSPNLIRFPGGNLSSIFFWNADVGQPPPDVPSKLIDASGNEIDPGYWYGKNTQGWTLSVDNYYNMLEATNSTGMITINYGYARYGMSDDPVAAAAHLAAEWVRRDAGRTQFWEIGNESNGEWQAGYRINTTDNKDGQPEIVTGALYGEHFKVFADSMRKAATQIGHTIYIGAQLLAEPPAGWWNETDREWNAGVFAGAGESPDYYIIHSYYTDFEKNSSADEILHSATAVSRNMMDYVSGSLQSAGLPPKPVALTEWNIFATGSRQQVSFINGMHAAIVLGELIANRYSLACRWNLANGWSDGNDHGMFSQGDQPGVPKWHARPVYFYQYYFQRYFGDHMVASIVQGNDGVLSYASTFTSGEVSVVVINTTTEAVTAAIDVDGFGYGTRYYYHLLTGGTDNGEFSLKVFVNGEGGTYPAGGPADPDKIKPLATAISGGIRVHLPPHSVQYVLIENGDNIITAVDRGELEEIQVFPNPADGQLTLTLPSGGFNRVELRDVHGKTVLERMTASHDRSLLIDARLSPGTYIMLLYRGKAVFLRKVVVH